MHSSVHIKPIDKKNDSYHYNSTINQSVLPIWQQIIGKPGNRNEKDSDKPDSQEAENSYD